LGKSGGFASNESDEKKLATGKCSLISALLAKGEGRVLLCLDADMKRTVWPLVLATVTGSGFVGGAAAVRDLLIEGFILQPLGWRRTTTKRERES
jgi:hypothetical protein